MYLLLRTSSFFISESTASSQFWRDHLAATFGQNFAMVMQHRIKSRNGKT